MTQQTNKQRAQCKPLRFSAPSGAELKASTPQHHHCSESKWKMPGQAADTASLPNWTLSKPRWALGFTSGSGNSSHRVHGLCPKNPSLSSQTEDAAQTVTLSSFCVVLLSPSHTELEGRHLKVSNPAGKIEGWRKSLFPFNSYSSITARAVGSDTHILPTR